MAIDIDKIKEDASGILGVISKLTPGGQIANLGKGNEAEIIKVIKELLKRTPPGQATEVVKFIVDRYQLDPNVAQRMVANQMTDANMPTDPSATADEGYTERGLGPDAGAEDYYLEKETGGISLEDYLEAIREGRVEKKILRDPAFPESPEEKTLPLIPGEEAEMEARYYGFMQGGRVGLAFGTPEAGIKSLDAGASDITYEGNEGPQAPQQMAFDDTPGFELEDLDLLIQEFKEDNSGREPISIDDLRRFFYIKYGPGRISKIDQAIKGKQMAAGPVIPSDEDPINPFTPKPTGPDLPEKMMAAQGGRIGFDEGANTKFAMIKDMLDKGMDIDTIMSITGATQEEINFVKNKEVEESESSTLNPIKKFKNFLIEQAGGGKNRIKEAQGGRIGFQTGGISETRTLPPEFIEALGKTYAADLTRQAGIPSITTATTQQPGETAEQFAQRQAQAQQFGITKAGMADLAPQVAAQDPYQAAAYAQAVDPTTGLGAYQPFLTKAGTAADAMSGLTGPMTTAQTTAYMSPYQQQVIDASMADYDAQAAKSRLGLGAQAVSGGAFGSGRHGIAEAEFDALSNRGRTSMLADLRQRGFQQASGARQQDLANQQAISNQQAGLGARALDFGRAQIAGLGGLGATQQAQNQAILDAQRQTAEMAIAEPRQRLGMLGSGVMGLMGGMGQSVLTDAPAAPQSSPLASALGYGLMGADIYGRIFG